MAFSNECRFVQDRLELFVNNSLVELFLKGILTEKEVTGINMHLGFCQECRNVKVDLENKKMEKVLVNKCS